jgi:parvulin-like peptidyl-prolyl isomerase
MEKKGSKYLIFFPLSFLLLFLINSKYISCEKQNVADSPIIARVGKTFLTMNDLNKSIPSEFSGKITQKQRINFVKQWIDTEILYQEALRQKIHEEKHIIKRLEQQEKELLGAEIISRNLQKKKKETISEESILNYYENFKDSFIREFDLVKYIEIVVEDLTTGWKVRNIINPINFFEIAEEYSLKPAQDPSRIPYVPINTLPQEIANIVSSLRINGTSSPIKMEDGVHIIRVLEKQKAGEVCMLDEVKDEIISTLSTKLQKKDLNDLLSELRKSSDYEFKYELITKEKNNVTATLNHEKTQSLTSNDSTALDTIKKEDLN